MSRMTIPIRSRTLSARERQVLGFLAHGLTGEEVAAALVISPETARTHVRNARRKLGARTQAHAVALALRSGELRGGAGASRGPREGVPARASLGRREPSRGPVRPGR